jgi:2'-5' RNA ligase
MNETQRQVKELLKKGLIRESTSPFAAPITLANKKDGTKRFYVDYHELNKNTIAVKEPMPHIQDVIDRLSGAKYFSKLDVA